MNESAPKRPADRWWLVSLLAAPVAMIFAVGVLYLPAICSWVILIGFAAFVVTYRFHPARWYRRRADAALGAAVVVTSTPGLKAVLHLGPDTVAEVVTKTGWPAIVLPWVAAMFFAYLDYLSRRPEPPSPRSDHTPPQPAIQQQQTGVDGGIHGENVEVNIYQQARAGGSEGTAPTQDADPPPQDADLPPGIALSKLLRYAADNLIGRTTQLSQLTRAWNDSNTHVVSFVAFGGVGKTALAVQWMSRFAGRDWEGVDAYFDWSFYSQGTRDEGAATAEPFIDAALRHFGGAELADSSTSPAEKGARLAELVADRKSLLILDGLEPLQYPKGKAGLDGQLEDPGLKALLGSLAQRPFAGLCVLTSREPLVDLQSFHGGTVVEWKLEHLSPEDGAALLHQAGARRAGAAAIGPDDAELLAVSREVKGHALTLQLLGRYLALAHEGDVRRCDRVRLDKADAKTQGSHAFRVIGAYERWLGEADDSGSQLAALRLLGLFDRPADPACLAALRKGPPIAGLTEPLVELDEDDWNIAIIRLVELGLISHDPSGPVDAHPLVREYFGRQLSQHNADTWRAAHRRLYEHLCETTERQPDTLAGLQPLYQAVAHGCHAGLHEQARADVYRDRILRGTGSGGNYSTFKLGAIGADLGAVACFFERPWRRLSTNLSPAARAWLLNEAAFRLRALGRLSEALDPMRVSMEMDIEREEWKGAAISASNLSELELTLGEVSAAVTDGQQSVTFADRSKDASLRIVTCTTHADALHQAGSREESLRLFREAEAMQAERQPQYPRLYSLPGFRYCDLLLADAERAAWRAFLSDPATGFQVGHSDLQACAAACHEVAERATQTLDWAEQNRAPLLDFALNHLTLGRTALYGALPKMADGLPLPSADGLRSEPATLHLTVAVDGLRQAGRMDYLPHSLLSRAWLRFVDADEPGSRVDLDEAQQIAERGSMGLFQADVQLTRARLFRDEAALDKAAGLIQRHEYHRRDEELADARRILFPGA